MSPTESTSGNTLYTRNSRPLSIITMSHHRPTSMSTITKSEDTSMSTITKSEDCTSPRPISINIMAPKNISNECGSAPKNISNECGSAPKNISNECGSAHKNISNECCTSPRAVSYISQLDYPSSPRPLSHDSSSRPFSYNAMIDYTNPSSDMIDYSNRSSNYSDPYTPNSASMHESGQDSRRFSFQSEQDLDQDSFHDDDEEDDLATPVRKSKALTTLGITHEDIVKANRMSMASTTTTESNSLADTLTKSKKQAKKSLFLKVASTLSIKTNVQKPTSPLTSGNSFDQYPPTPRSAASTGAHSEKALKLLGVLKTKTEELAPNHAEEYEQHSAKVMQILGVKNQADLPKRPTSQMIKPKLPVFYDQERAQAISVTVFEALDSDPLLAGHMKNDTLTSMFYILSVDTLYEFRSNHSTQKSIASYTIDSSCTVNLISALQNYKFQIQSDKGWTKSFYCTCAMELEAWIVSLNIAIKSNQYTVLDLPVEPQVDVVEPVQKEMESFTLPELDFGGDISDLLLIVESLFEKEATVLDQHDLYTNTSSNPVSSALKLIEKM